MHRLDMVGQFHISPCQEKRKHQEIHTQLGSIKQIPMEKWDCPEALTSVLQAARVKIYFQLDRCSGKEFWRASLKRKTNCLALPRLIGPGKQSPGICPVNDGLELLQLHWQWATQDGFWKGTEKIWATSLKWEFQIPIDWRPTPREGRGVENRVQRNCMWVRKTAMLLFW